MHNVVVKVPCFEIGVHDICLTVNIYVSYKTMLVLSLILTALPPYQELWVSLSAKLHVLNALYYSARETSA